MASKELDSSNIKRQEELEDITTCCICTDVYTDPKALPCIHTFCKTCIEKIGLKTNRGPEDEMPCPICRRLFKIPAEGFGGLPRNFFIERLIQIAKDSVPSTETKDACSVCMEESKEQEGKETPTADAYCVECKYKLCEECCSEHRKFKATKNHRLMPLNEFKAGQNMWEEHTPSVREVHEQQDLNVYCADCKTVVGAICFIEEHKNHEGSSVSKCVDGFRKQIEDNTKALNRCIAEAQIKMTEIMTVKEEMNQRMESLEGDVERRKEEIKQLTDKHASCLLQSLYSERQGRLKDIQMAKDDTDAYISNLESYNSYCQRILEKGSASDICSALSNLSTRAGELQQACQPIIERQVSNFGFSFSQSELEEFLNDDSGNLVGYIQGEGCLKPKKRSNQILLAELDNENDLLRKEMENDRTEKNILQSETEQQRINANKEEQILREELIKEKTIYKTPLEKLKEVLNNNKITNNLHQIISGKSRQELVEEKTNNVKLVEELERCKTKLKSAEAKAEKLRKELWTSKSGEQRYRSDPVLVQTIRTRAIEDNKKAIQGLSILDKELFVVSDFSSEVEVYDSIQLRFSRRWNLKQLFNPWDIASCIRNKCLYISDSKGFNGKSNAILRVDINGNVIKIWSTGVGYGRLSVTNESTVILASYSQNKLNEYSPDGLLIREIYLSSTAGIRHPWHAVKLTNGHFVVSHGDFCNELHRVCIVDAGGNVKKSFGGKLGSAIGQMSYPAYLSVDRNRFVMVVDRMNHRVLLLDSDLQFKREILSKGKHRLSFTQKILLDEATGQLFVANFEMILIFD